MKNYEKNSFLKISILFFSVLTIFTTVIAYLYLKEQKMNLDTSILLEMKEFNYNFKNKKFKIDIVSKPKIQNYFILYNDERKELYSLFPLSQVKNKSLKVIYPYMKYKVILDAIEYKVFITYLYSLIFLFIFSISSAYYVLYPIRKAFNILDEFFKDIVHDLNTPITSILLNSKFLLKTTPSKEIQWIELSARRISDLYKNFESLTNTFKKESIDSIQITPIIIQRVEYFQQIYPDIQFILKLEDNNYFVHQSSFIRIIDNIISNSCKYNKSKGKVTITTVLNQLIISDTGIGIKNPQNVFDRYYKETNRGIGIGMNIVQKLCIQNNIKINIDSTVNIGTNITLTFKQLTLK